jgi:hypothetical protein
MYFIHFAGFFGFPASHDFPAAHFAAAGVQALWPRDPASQSACRFGLPMPPSPKGPCRRLIVAFLESSDVHLV